MKLEAKGMEEISQYVRRLTDEASARNESVEGEFNGTPVVARPGESDDVVSERWFQGRITHQAREFLGEVRALDAAVSGRKIVSVGGSFRFADVNEIRIALDDGTELVTSNLMRVPSVKKLYEVHAVRGCWDVVPDGVKVVENPDGSLSCYTDGGRSTFERGAWAWRVASPPSSPSDRK